MGYTPKQLTENVNVSKTHPLIEFSWLVGSLIVLLGLLFLLLIASADWAVSKTPVEVEEWIGHLALDNIAAQENIPLEQRLKKLVDSLPAYSPLRQYNFHVFLDDSDSVNAVALPGSNIVVYRGLLDKVKSENELAMVLAHELGHFAHRDHLRSLGRGLGLTLLTTMIFGQDSSASNLVAKALLTFQTKYSREQETAADQFGVDLLARRYGHAGGATDFFVRINKDAGEKLPYLLASHPHPQDRIDALNERIRKQHYPIAKTEPLASDLLSEQ